MSDIILRDIEQCHVKGSAFSEIRKILLPHENFRNFVIPQLQSKFTERRSVQKYDMILWKATLLGEMLRVRFGQYTALIVGSATKTRKLWKMLNNHSTRSIMTELLYYNFLRSQKKQLMDMCTGITSDLEKSDQSIKCESIRHSGRHGCPECDGIVERGITYAKLSFVTGEERMIDAAFGISVLKVRLHHMQQHIDHLTSDIDKLYTTLSTAILIHFQLCWSVRLVARRLEREESLSQINLQHYIKKRINLMKLDIRQSCVASCNMLDRSRHCFSVLQLEDKYCDIPIHLKREIGEQMIVTHHLRRLSVRLITSCFRRYMHKKYMNKISAARTCRILPSLTHDPIQRVIQHRAYLASLPCNKRLDFQIDLSSDVKQLRNKVEIYEHSLLWHCPQCGKRFKFKSMFEKHLDFHEKERERAKILLERSLSEAKFVDRIKRSIIIQPAPKRNIWTSFDDVMAVPIARPPLTSCEGHFCLSVWNESPLCKQMDAGFHISDKYDIVQEISKFGYDNSCDIRVSLSESAIQSPVIKFISSCHFFIQIVSTSDSRFKEELSLKVERTHRAIIRDNHGINGTWILRGNNTIQVPSIGKNALFLMPKDIIGVGKTASDEFLILFMFDEK